MCAAAITVTESTTRRLVFTFEMEGFSSTVEGSGGGGVVSIRFSDQNCAVVLDGGEVVPGQSVFFGAPRSGAVTVSCTPLATRRMTLEGALRSHGTAGAAAEDHTPRFLSPWISTVDFNWFGGYRVGRLYIRPFMYEPSSRTLTLLFSATVTVEFSEVSPAPSAVAAVPADYGLMLEKMLLNYPVARGWGRPLAKARPKSAAIRGFADADQMLTFGVGDGHVGFNEGTTDENGVVKITGADASMLRGQAIHRISLYASPQRPLNRGVPHPDAIPDGVIEVPCMRVDVDNDGVFDAEDYLLAYVTGTSDWFFNDSNRFEYMVNPYDDDRHYWLALNSTAARTLPVFAQPPAGPAPASTFEDRVMYRRVLALDNRDGTPCEQSGTCWFWWTFSSTAASFSLPISLPGRVSGSGGAVKIGAMQRSSMGTSALSVSVGGVHITSACDTAQWYPVASWAGDTISLQFSDQSSDRKGFFELTYIDIKYLRRLDMTGLTKLRIFSSSDSGLVAYSVSGFPAETCYILRIPADESQMSLLATIAPGTGSYTWTDTGGIGVRYVAVTQSGLSTAPALTPWYRRSSDGTYDVRKLRSASQSADYLIITDSLLAAEAVRLARHKYDIGRFASPRVVSVHDIYREFAGGNADPAAIRNFLLHAYHFWHGGAPSYVVLFGNGHYDYKGYLSDETVHVPTAQIKENCIEDFFAYLDSGEDASLPTPPVPDMYIGRIPVNTVSEAAIVVDKIIRLEGAEADWGAWRNRVLLVADDDQQGANRDPISSSNPHHRSSEDVETVIMNRRPSVEMRKVYLFEYEWNEVYLKPEASRALINEINNGVQCVNYFGHGSDDRWADEGLLSIESISSLANENRYPVITSFSCSVGRFDKPSNESLSDALLKTASAGASVSISSTRKAYASDNEKLAESFYHNLFDPTTPWTVGQAYVRAKSEAGNLNKNQRNYAMFGDPSLRLLTITDTVALTVVDKNGAATTTLKALEQGVSVRGTVLRGGAANAAFGTAAAPATVRIGLYNPPQDSAKRKDGGAGNVTYRLPGTPVFIGTTQFSGGRFEQNIFLPRNLFFNTSGVKLIAYAWQGAAIGVGIKSDIIFDGIETGAVSDTTGPSIMIRPVYGNRKWDGGAAFTDRIIGMLPLECEISLYDESGIDVAGVGPDEGLTVEVPGAFNRRNINHKFLFNEGDFRRGRATITLEEGDLAEGEHEMKISGQDLLGNISRICAIVEILPFSQFKLGQVFNYPNPFRMGQTTRFFFSQSNTYANDPNKSWYGTIQATIKIYTLSGKLVRVLRDAANGQQWDGTDQYGRQLAPNVYLYRVVVDVNMPEVKKTEKSGIKKLVIRPPR